MNNWIDVLIKEEQEQAEKRGGILYAAAYIEGLNEGLKYERPLPEPPSSQQKDVEDEVPVKIEKCIDNYLGKYNNRHSHYPNELMYGYCGNGNYELSHVDVKELSEEIAKSIQPAQQKESKIFKCKCGYETGDSTAWCIHADCCNGEQKDNDVAGDENLVTGKMESDSANVVSLTGTKSNSNQL